MRAEQGETNLEKLARLEELLADLSTGAVDVPAASREVDAILTEQPRYRGRLVVAAAPLSCASATVFFGGGWREVLATLALSSVLVALARLLAPRPNSGRLVELLSAALAAVAADGCAALPAPWGPIAPSVLLLASMLPLVPGLSLTVAMSELANRHLVSGSARLAGALTTFVMLGFGVALGQRIAAQLVAATPAVAAVPLAAWTTFPALLATSLAFLVLFQAPPRDYRWVLAGVALAVFAGQLGAELFGRELGAFAGALAVGLGSNLVGRLLGRPGAITQLPGLMVLVPGSLGFRSVNALLAEDVLSGVQTAFSMVLVAVALVTGLLTANVLLPSRRPL